MPPATFLTLNLLPLTVIQLVLVCFLLHLARPTGETCCLTRLDRRPDLRLPWAANGDEVLRGPVIEIARTETRVANDVVGDIAALANGLLTYENNFRLLHPGETFERRVLVSADRDIPWRRLRDVLAAAGRQDYRIVDFLVETDAPPVGDR